MHEKAETDIQPISWSERFVKHEYLIMAIACAALFLLHTYTVGKFYTFTIWDDEFCYWGSASYLSGMDWSSAMSTANYYSYGPSLLLLPLMWLFHNPVTLYRAALILNGFMLTWILPLSYGIAKRHYPDANRMFLLMVCLCVSVLPAYYIQSSMTMAESALYLVFWLIVYLMDRLKPTSGYWMVVLLGILLPYSYMIHQRSIGIVMAAGIALMYMVWKRTVRIRQIVVLAVVSLMLFAIHSYLKPKIQSELWLGSTKMQENDYALQLIKFKNLFQLEGFLRFVRVCCGQLFYLGASTFSMAYIGFYAIGRRAFRALRAKTSSQPPDRETDGRAGLWMFLILSALSTFAISCIFMYYSPYKADHVIYGRYNEVFAGLLVLFGLLDMRYHHEKRTLKFAICAAILLVTGLIAKNTIEGLGLSEYNLFCIPGFTLTRYFPKNPMLAALIGSIGGTGLMLGLSCLGKRHRGAFAAAAGFLICFFIATGHSLTAMAISAQAGYHSAHDALSHLQSADADLPVYFMRNNQPSNNSWRGHIQFMMLDQPLLCEDEDVLLHDLKDKFVIQRNLNTDADETTFIEEMEKTYTLFYTNGEYTVWVRRGI